MDEQTIIDRVRFTPAERAVLRERCEAMQVSLRAMEQSTDGVLVAAWVLMQKEVNFVTGLVSDKVTVAYREVTGDL